MSIVCILPAGRAVMPTAARPKIWGVGQASSRYPKPLSNFTARAYKPPKLKLQPKRVPTVGDHTWRESLKVQAETWTREADALEASAEDTATVEKKPTFLPIEVDLGRILLKLESKGTKVEEQLREWDKTGDGSISMGEFRLRLRGLGFDKYTTADIDGLFGRYDRDSSGTIDLAELKKALKRLKAAARVLCRPKHKESEGSLKARELRAKAAAACEAISCANRADAADEELALYREQHAARLDLALGALLAKRHVQVGEMVRLWPKPRMKTQEKHKKEVSKEEFKDEVRAACRTGTRRAFCTLTRATSARAHPHAQ